MTKITNKIRLHIGIKIIQLATYIIIFGEWFGSNKDQRLYLTRRTDDDG